MSHEHTLGQLAATTGKVVYTVRITFPHGPTHEYTRLVEPEFLHNDELMRFYADDAQRALRKAAKDIGEFPAPVQAPNA